jgi:hypothetical protein
MMKICQFVKPIAVGLSQFIVLCFGFHTRELLDGCYNNGVSLLIPVVRLAYINMIRRNCSKATTTRDPGGVLVHNLAT